jgi:hypothetical protein
MDVLVSELRYIVNFNSFAFDITSKSDPSRPLIVLALGPSEHLQLRCILMKKSAARSVHEEAD